MSLLFLKTNIFFSFQVITEFENLQILYLHGNMIKDMKEIEKLSVMKSLRKLTFHGNPVENSKVNI